MSGGEVALIIVLIAVAIVFIAFAAKAVNIVRPYQKGLVERLGKYKVTVDPGLRIILPFIDNLRRVDMREQVVDVPPQEVITEDNVVVTVDAVVYYEATDPQRLAYNVANFVLAVTKLAQTNLRNVVGDMSLDQALTSRDVINHKLRDVLDEATDKWGTRVVRVEIQRIDPPRDVVEAMHQQMRAERTRRALVTEAQGDREAAITRAEGEKQSAILAAEGHKEQEILQAEGEANAIKAIAEANRFRLVALGMGEAEQTRAVFKAIHDGGPSEDLVAIRYLDALAKIANGRATKVFLPADSRGLFNQLAGIGELFKSIESEPAPDGHHEMP